MAVRPTNAKLAANVRPGQSDHRATIKARQFGCKTRPQSGNSPRPLREEFGRNYDVNSVGNNNGQAYTVSHVSALPSALTSAVAGG
jgi:hypothetical protein